MGDLEGFRGARLSMRSDHEVTSSEKILGGSNWRNGSTASRWPPAFGHLVARKLKQTTANVELAFEPASRQHIARQQSLRR